MPTPTVINKYRYSDVINRRYWDTSYVFDGCQTNPVCTKIVGGAAAGAGAEVDAWSTSRNTFEQFVIVGNTNIQPQLDGSYGLNFAPDATNTHGCEYNTGSTALNPFTWKIDTSGATQNAFFMKMNWKVATVAGALVIFGFRKVQANNATLSSYTDFAAIGLVDTSGHLKTETQIGSGGVVTTDTTNVLTDATAYEAAIFVDATGNVTYQLNGSTPTTVAAYQFANGITVMPFWRVVQNATTTATASSNYIEWGYQS